MTQMQTFLMGMMAAWTPSVLILAWLVYRAPPEQLADAEQETERAHRSATKNETQRGRASPLTLFQQDDSRHFSINHSDEEIRW